MNRLVISPRHLHAIGRHAASVYPGECCGVLMGRPARNGVLKVLVQRILCLQMPEGAPGSEGDPVSPETWAAAESEARAAGLEVVGLYLARGGCAATPDELEVPLHPGLSYLLTAIESGEVRESRSWRLRADGSLEEEAVDVSAG